MWKPRGALSFSCLVLWLSASTAASAAETNEGVSLGFTLNRFQDDFGASGTLASPTFFRHTARVMLGGGIAWFPRRMLSDGTEAWELYGHLRLAMEAGTRIDGFPLRLYGFAGSVLLIPPKTLTSRRVLIGGIGGVGFEFYMPREGKDGPVSCLIELGGIGTGAYADNAIGEPIFANGFLTSVGLRFYP